VVQNRQELSRLFIPVLVIHWNPCMHPLLAGVRSPASFRAIHPNPLWLFSILGFRFLECSCGCPSRIGEETIRVEDDHHEKPCQLDNRSISSTATLLFCQNRSRRREPTKLPRLRSSIDNGPRIPGYET
jgi:hypothetical protein